MERAGKKTAERKENPDPRKYSCSMPDCTWQLNGKLATWQALPIFGQHNAAAHGGTISAHLVPPRIR